MEVVFFHWGMMLYQYAATGKSIVKTYQHQIDFTIVRVIFLFLGHILYIYLGHIFAIDQMSKIQIETGMWFTLWCVLRGTLKSPKTLRYPGFVQCKNFTKGLQLILFKSQDSLYYSIVPRPAIYLCNGRWEWITSKFDLRTIFNIDKVIENLIFYLGCNKSL